MENFQKCQELQDKQTKTKVVLERWKAQVEESRNNYWRHYPTWRRRIHRICNHPYWDVLVTCVICANVIMMSMEHYQMSHVCFYFVSSCCIFHTFTCAENTTVINFKLRPSSFPLFQKGSDYSYCLSKLIYHFYLKSHIQSYADHGKIFPFFAGFSFDTGNRQLHLHFFVRC